MTVSSIRILVAEDEPMVRRSLVVNLQELWDQNLDIVECEDGQAVVSEYEAFKPQVMFLDINMPGENGLDLAKRFCRDVHIVFTTAYDQYAVDAFRVAAVDYLLKPVTKTDLAKTIQRLQQRIERTPDDKLQSVLEKLEDRHRDDKSELKWITASLGDKVLLIAVEDVLYFQAEDKHVKVVTEGQEAIIREPLVRLKERLNPDQFWQIQRGILVAVAAIEQVSKNELGKRQIKIRNLECCLPISQRFAARFRSM